MLDIVKPAARRKSDAIIIHEGTNDITRNINMKKNRKIVKSIRDCSEYTRYYYREDVNYNNKISKINTRMASYSEGQRLLFVDNDNVDGTCLNRGRLRLNKTGYSKFSLNLIE